MATIHTMTFLPSAILCVVLVTVADKKRCIPMERCTCMEDNYSHEEGTVIERYCQTCTCKDRKFECVGESCKPNCTDNQFVCKSTGQCLDEDKECDGIMDCLDGSDERDCKDAADHGSLH